MILNSKWRYRNTALLAASVVLLLIFADHAIVRGFLSGISGLGYLAIFLSGFFIVSTFTIVPATLLLAELAKSYGFWELAIFATLGAILGDFIIFKFVRDTVSDELDPLIKFIAQEKHLKRLFHTPLFIWITPVIGAAIIASPLPDELGLGILGMQRMTTLRFLALVTVLDFLGVMLLLSVLRTL
jgi:uncharacterized membrane protein YdjX (TVP38/TMEM64 family)